MRTAITRLGPTGALLALFFSADMAPVYAGSCCGGGTAAALLMPKSAKLLVAGGADAEKYAGYYDRGGRYLSDPPGSDLMQYRLNGGVAYRLASRWQAALAGNYVFNANTYSGLRSRTNGPGDSMASVTYEAFDAIKCVWKVRSLADLVPAVYLGAQALLPTGISPYDDVKSSFDITGRGFYRADAKAILEKTIYPFTLAVTLIYGTHAARPVNRDYGTYVEPYRKRLGDRLQTMFGVSYSYFTDAMASITATVTYTYLNETNATINGREDVTSGFHRNMLGVAMAYANADRDLIYIASYSPAVTMAELQRNFPTTHAISLGVTYVLR